MPTKKVSRGERFGMRDQPLGSFGGGTQIGVAMETLPPGKQANPAQYHLLEEEHVFILDGSLTLRPGDKSWLLSEGHYVRVPARQKAVHALLNHTAEPCRYLVLGNPRPHDVIVFTDTGRVSVKLTGESYRKPETTE